MYRKFPREQFVQLTNILLVVTIHKIATIVGAASTRNPTRYHAGVCQADTQCTKVYTVMLQQVFLSWVD